MNLDFAPVMDVVPAGTEAQNQPIGALHREFGSDPATVADHGTAFIRGKFVAYFEKAYAVRYGVKHCVSWECARHPDRMCRVPRD